MDIKNSMLLANMMSNKGGVEFKTYCYALNDGCCLIEGLTVNGFKVKGKLIDTSSVFSSYVSWIIAGGSQYKTGATNWLSAGVFSTQNSQQKRLGIGYMGGSIYDELVDSSGNIIKTDFEFSRTGFSGYSLTKLCLFAYLWGYMEQNNYFQNFMNDKVKIQNIVLYNGNTEVANLVPAIVEGESGMFDTINEQFYGNANSVGSLVCE